MLLQEVVQVDGKTLIVPPGQRAGQNIRRAGEDLARGAVALAAGKRIGPAELGLMASLGLAEVAVRRRLRVAILATGDVLPAAVMHQRLDQYAQLWSQYAEKTHFVVQAWNAWRKKKPWLAKG